MTVTVRQLQKSCPCLQIGDIAFLGDKPYNERALNRSYARLAKEDWFQPLRRFHPCGALCDTPNTQARAFSCREVLQAAYSQARKSPQKPDWLQFLSKDIRHLLDCNWLRVESPVYKIIPKIAYTGVGMIVLPGGLIEAVDRTFGLGRLNRIHQLASLHSPVVTNKLVHEWPTKFDHTRYRHSLEVCAIATLIGYRCGLTPEEMVLLRVAAWSHDALTCAGGDSLKVIDPIAFDEDANYPLLFKLPRWPHLRDSYGLQEERLVEIILGKGLLGSILDTADKLAYIGTDTAQFLALNWEDGFAWETFTDTYSRIQALLRTNPYPCSVWECAERRGDELVFTDGNRLANFLCLRACMFKILYANASSRFMEAGLVAELAKILYHDGVLTKDNLLTMDDTWLFGVFNRALGSDIVWDPVSTIDHTKARVELFETFQEALEFEQKVAKEQPGTMTGFEKAPPSPNKCLNTFKVVKNRKVVPFSQACSDETKDICQISHEPKPYRVFVYELSSICPNTTLRRRLLAARNKRISTKQ